MKPKGEQEEEMEKEGNRGCCKKRELKYSMPTFHPLVDNYAPRRYKELGSSKLKALEINQREKSGTRSLAVPILRHDRAILDRADLFFDVSILVIFFLSRNVLVFTLLFLWILHFCYD